MFTDLVWTSDFIDRVLKKLNITVININANFIKLRYLPKDNLLILNRYTFENKLSNLNFKNKL